MLGVRERIGPSRYDRDVPRGQKKGSRLGPLLGIGFVLGIGSLIVWDCKQKDHVREVRDQFFASARAGDLDAAYAQLSAERRAVMSRAEFEAFIQHPVFLDPDVTYYPPEPDAPGWCVDARVDLPDGRWALQIFLLEEDDGLHVHSLAAQRPARVQLGTLLPACGFWKGTMMGYSGPPPDPTTRTTRSQW